MANWRTADERAPNQRPYVRYSSNGTNRIDFIASQGNPGEVNGDPCGPDTCRATDPWHEGAVLGPLDGSVRFSQLTPVFNGTPSQAGARATRRLDLQNRGRRRRPPGRRVLGPASDTAEPTRHRPLRPPVLRRSLDSATAGRCTKWRTPAASCTPSRTTTPGRLTAIDPADPNHMFISTNVNPSTGEVSRFERRRPSPLGDLRGPIPRPGRDLDLAGGHLQLDGRQHPTDRRRRPARQLGPALAPWPVHQLRPVQPGGRGDRRRDALGDDPSEADPCRRYGEHHAGTVRGGRPR